MSTKDESSVNTHYLKIGGKAELPTPIEIGHNYKVTLHGSVVSATEADNNDGSRTFYYKFVPVMSELVTETGETLKLKDVRSSSQRFRARVWAIWKEQNYDGEFEEFYERLMTNLIQSGAEVVEMYHK